MYVYPPAPWGYQAQKEIYRSSFLPVLLPTVPLFLLLLKSFKNSSYRLLRSTDLQFSVLKVCRSVVLGS